MEIVTPQDFFRILKNSYLLLDTNVFIDAFHNPNEFGKYFNNLKENGVTLVTIDAVLIEFTKGSTEIKKLQEKNEYFNNVVDAILPIDKSAVNNTYELLKRYKIEAKDISIVDLLLGGMLVKYKGKILLMTKDIKDFPTNIYELKTFLNIVRSKSIHNFGIFSFTK